MKKIGVAITVLGLVASILGPAQAAPKMKSLGTDPAGDGPPALDLTYLEVGRTGDALEIRIGIDTMLPPFGGYPDLPGIEWIFDAQGRTFLAEAVARPGEPDFYLFELVGDSATQLEKPTGTYSTEDGYTSILVPLEVIDVTRGTRISGHGPKGTPDADAHVHHVGTYYADYLTTTKDFIVP